MIYRFNLLCSLCFLVFSQMVAACGSGKFTEPKMTFSMELDRGKLLAGPTQSAVLKVSLKAPEIEATQDRQPVNVCLVLDVSGSMRGKKMAAAKRGALEAISRLGSNDKISVITYSDSAHVLLPATSARKAKAVEAAIQKLRADGDTALFAGVSLGAAELRKSLETHRVHRLVLLSDGQANRGPDTPEDLGRLGTALSKEGIAVSTLGLGNDYNEDLMTQLSQSSEGNTYYVENSADLSRIFQGELGNVLNVYAQKVAVQLNFPKDVQPVAILGRDGRINDNQVTIPLKQINGGQEKFAMVQVTILNGKVNEKRVIAAGEAMFMPLHEKVKKTLHSEALTTFVKKEAEVVASVNKVVQRDALIMQNTAAVDKALTLATKGQNKEAAAELRKSAKELYRTAEVNQDEKLRKKAKEMSSYAADIETQKLDKKKRKVLKTQNYQTQSQQPISADPEKKEQKKRKISPKPTPQQKKGKKKVDDKSKKPKPTQQSNQNEKENDQLPG